MKGFTLTALLLAQAPAIAPDAEVRALTVIVLDQEGKPAEGLGRPDVAISENGEARDVTSFKVDRRPLTVAVIVDSSRAVVFRPNMVEAVTRFISHLPSGTSYTVWTTGDRPRRILDYTEDPEDAPRVLDHVTQSGANYMLDALAEASKDLEKNAREADRTVIVAVSGGGPAVSHRDRRQAVKSTEKNADLYLALKIEVKWGLPPGAADVDYVFDELTEATGGAYEQTLSYGEMDARLLKLSHCLRAGYRLAYATLPDLKKRKIEVTVARPGTRVLVPVHTEPQTELDPEY
jgi:VWFA-related protein